MVMDIVWKTRQNGAVIARIMHCFTSFRRHAVAPVTLIIRPPRPTRSCCLIIVFRLAVRTCTRVSRCLVCARALDLASVAEGFAEFLT